MRTVADGCGEVADVCERLGNVERKHSQPPDPQSETGTLATHSGKNCRHNENTGGMPSDSRRLERNKQFKRGMLSDEVANKFPEAWFDYT